MIFLHNNGNNDTIKETSSCKFLQKNVIIANMMQFVEIMLILNSIFCVAFGKKPIDFEPAKMNSTGVQICKQSN